MSYEELLDYKLGPIQEWPGELTPDGARVRSPFSSPFTMTKQLLSRELYNLGAEVILVQFAMREHDFRIDGMPRARALAAHPGVIVSFNPDGVAGERMEFATDRFRHWQDNLRAIALGLEALRKVDRYAITNGRQQYAGFRALPRGDDGTMGLYTPADAGDYLRRFVNEEESATGVAHSVLLRRGLMQTHPDRGGEPDEFRRVMRAKELLGL